jgi:hypothetical protein
MKLLLTYSMKFSQLPDVKVHIPPLTATRAVGTPSPVTEELS